MYDHFVDSAKGAANIVAGALILNQSISFENKAGGVLDALSVFPSGFQNDNSVGTNALNFSSCEHLRMTGIVAFGIDDPLSKNVCVLGNFHNLLPDFFYKPIKSTISELIPMRPLHVILDLHEFEPIISVVDGVGETVYHQFKRFGTNERDALAGVMWLVAWLGQHAKQYSLPFSATKYMLMKISKNKDAIEGWIGGSILGFSD